jgi:serine/threonine-protein kinase
MGEVWRADDLVLGTPVALKFIRSSANAAPASILNEVRLARKITHPAVCRVFDVGESDGEFFFTMELVRGEDLASLIKRVGRLPSEKVIDIARQLCAGLTAAHAEGVLHRDLKPANVMIDDDGHVRITDFGIAVAGGDKSPQVLVGTPDYMAPEQVKGQRGDARTDIYSLGAILYEMVTGSPPFEGSNPLVIMNSRLTGDPIAPRKKNAQLSPGAEEIILHAMARKPDDRYASAADLRRDLDYPMEVQITGRADRLQPVKPISTGLRRYFPLFLAAGVVILFFAIFLLSKLRIHIEMK